MAGKYSKRVHRIEVRGRHGDISDATLELEHLRIKVLPLIAPQSRYPTLELTVLRAVAPG
jgi:hypothetical protein